MQGVNENALSSRIIGAAIEVHRELGPGLLESVYESALAYELARAGIRVERQVAFPVQYKTEQLDLGFRADLVVDRLVLIEIKAIEKLMPIHEVQVLTYLRISRRLGLLINFNVSLLKSGVRRVVNNL
jgi:GxxExxY protein